MESILDAAATPIYFKANYNSKYIAHYNGNEKQKTSHNSGDNLFFPPKVLGFSPDCILCFNPIVLRTDKILLSFGCSECNRANVAFKNLLAT